jgi:hypothetical protein
MSKHVLVTIADRSGDPVEVDLFIDVMTAQGWQVVDGQRFSFTREVPAEATAEALAAQIRVDLENAGHRADWGRSQAVFTVSDEAPQVLTIDPWREPSA